MYQHCLFSLTDCAQFTYAHVELDKNPVGLLLVCPTALGSILDFFKCPKEPREGTDLVAVLVPWKVTVDNYQDKQWFATRRELYLKGGRMDSELNKRTDGSRKLLNTDFNLGLRIHQFPPLVYEFLARTPRAYCIWHSPADGPREAPGFETRILVAVLNALKARDVGLKTDVRVIFVHVGALKTFHKLGALAMRRCKQPDMRIYTYGTDRNVPPSRWYMREIYPVGTSLSNCLAHNLTARCVGGVVTFTPLAMMRGLFDICDLIVRINKHVLWTCYIHPLAVGAIARMAYPREDPVKLLAE